ncbi:MAG TPA: hypothetical protein VEW68_08320 [Patescibacteria group bacterium]|nr:hypothetical protein [Patescibacteria group bacterium]
MKLLRSARPDRRRSQRGSVLSGVLIITAFLAILSAALVTALSTNLLVSRNLVHRVTNEATVSSAMTLAIDQIQNTVIGQPCPAPNPINVNQINAVASYITCSTAVDSGSPGISAVAGGSSAFSVDGTHVVLGSSGWNVDEFLVGDAASLYELNFGASAANWKYPIGGPLTGPATAVPDTSSGAPNVIDLLPTASGCGGAPGCVRVLTEVPGQYPKPSACPMAAGGLVTSRPAACIRNSTVVFFGDSNGDLYAYTPGSSGDADCTFDDSVVIPDGLPVVAGPFVFPGPTGVDEVYVVASDGTSGELVRYAYQASGFFSLSYRDLPYAGVQGVALDGSVLPARLAIDYSGGRVTLAQISGSFAISLFAGAATLPTGIGAPPFWCQCAGANLIGVGGLNGHLYVLDTTLALHASFAGGSAITTTPTADAAGDWFFGADDGYLYEVVQPRGQTAMVQAGAFGPMDGAVGSSAVAGPCSSSLCVYVGTQGRHEYLTTFDARNVVMTACISTSLPTCSGDNPRLWASVQIGAMGAPTAVRVSGWSYYSP